MPTFAASTTLPHPIDEVFAWHERPGALQRLTPPYLDVTVLEQSGGIRDGGRVVLRVSRGPVTIRWELEHVDFEEGRRFRDRQVKGPLERWVHTHRFDRASDGGTVVTDEVEWEPPLGSMAEFFTRGTVERELRSLFAFRHRRLRNDLELHGRFRDRPPQTVAISGASGLIGSHLRHFLTAGGHTVLPMVRTQERARKEEGAIYWNWRREEIDRDALERSDSVVHLAAESLMGIRWTREKKRAIWDSRVKGTEFIGRTMAGLHSGPATLLNAAAVGYYGGRGDEILDESSRPGRGFLADVCKAWEGATGRAERSGIRVARLRTGFVLNAEGGALGAMLMPFKLGLGGRLGSGKQYVPWIDLDDEVGIIHHALMKPEVEGPLNLTAPDPVPQATFSSTLGRVLGRPTVVPVPSLAVKALLGEMGSELLLQGQRAKPERPRSFGYRYLFEALEDSLRFQLGKMEGE